MRECRSKVSKVALEHSHFTTNEVVSQQRQTTEKKFSFQLLPEGQKGKKAFTALKGTKKLLQ